METSELKNNLFLGLVESITIEQHWIEPRYIVLVNIKQKAHPYLLSRQFPSAPTALSYLIVKIDNPVHSGLNDEHMAIPPITVKKIRRIKRNETHQHEQETKSQDIPEGQPSQLSEQQNNS